MHKVTNKWQSSATISKPNYRLNTASHSKSCHADLYVIDYHQLLDFIPVYHVKPGFFKTTTTEDNVTRIYDLLLRDRRLRVHEIAKIVGIAKDRMGYLHIPHKIMGMKKLSAWQSKQPVNVDIQTQFLHQTTYLLQLFLKQFKPKS